jgi:hypothetical protein
VISVAVDTSVDLYPSFFSFFFLLDSSSCIGSVYTPLKLCNILSSYFYTPASLVFKRFGASSIITGAGYCLIIGLCVIMSSLAKEGGLRHLSLPAMLFRKNDTFSSCFIRPSLLGEK